MKNLVKSVAKKATPSLIDHPYFFHLALLRIDQVGPLTFHKCLQYFESPKQVFSASSNQLRDIGLKQSIIDQCKGFYKEHLTESSVEQNAIFQGVKKDIAWLDQPNHFLVSSEDSNYPTRLKEIYSYPPLLFVIGNISLLSRDQIAVVGSRRPSKLGTLDAHSFSKILAEKGFVVTSGLANGIDSFAHEGALASNEESTIAVLAHGLDGIYPKRNQSLAAKIINSGGALVSEFPVGVLPKPEYFPRRNRIISGLSLGVLVVEAAVKSGSLITAYCALEQGREVFAIPGSIHNPVAKGCHRLIKDGAKLVESCDDIFEELREQPSTKERSIEQKEMIKLQGKELKIHQYLSHEESNANEIAAALGLSISEVSANLTLLELKGLIIQGESGYMRKQSERVM